MSRKLSHPKMFKNQPPGHTLGGFLPYSDWKNLPRPPEPLELPENLKTEWKSTPKNVFKKLSLTVASKNPSSVVFDLLLVLFCNMFFLFFHPAASELASLPSPLSVKQRLFVISSFSIGCLRVKEHNVLVRVLSWGFFGRGGGKKSFDVVYLFFSFWGYSLLLCESKNQIMIGSNRVGGEPKWCLNDSGPVQISS